MSIKQNQTNEVDSQRQKDATSGHRIKSDPRPKYLNELVKKLRKIESCLVTKAEGSGEDFVKWRPRF